MKISDIELHPSYAIPVIVLLCIFVISAIFTCTIAFSWYTADKPGAIMIKQVILTSNIDKDSQPADALPTFNQSINRIYCVIDVVGILGQIGAGGIMQLKWYYGTEQIAGNYMVVDARYPIIVWLEPPTNEQFSRGDYKVEIFISYTLVETLHFKIE